MVFIIASFIMLVLVSTTVSMLVPMPTILTVLVIVIM